MNQKLKAKIIEKYGTQADFAQAIDIDETLISRVVRRRRKLNPAIQKKWADALECKSEDLFADES